MVKTICTPLKAFKINTEDIKVLVCISLSMIPIFLKELNETKEACKAKNIKLNIKNMKIILAKYFLSSISRVNEIEESLVAKGYNSE